MSTVGDAYDKADATAHDVEIEQINFLKDKKAAFVNLYVQTPGYPANRPESFFLQLRRPSCLESTGEHQGQARIRKPASRLRQGSLRKQSSTWVGSQSRVGFLRLTICDFVGTLV